MEEQDKPSNPNAKGAPKDTSVPGSTRKKTTTTRRSTDTSIRTGAASKTRKPAGSDVKEEQAVTKDKKVQISPEVPQRKVAKDALTEQVTELKKAVKKLQKRKKLVARARKKLDRTEGSITSAGNKKLGKKKIKKLLSKWRKQTEAVNKKKTKLKSAIKKAKEEKQKLDQESGNLQGSN